MRYKHLSEERKEFIDDVVAQLKANYSTNDGIDWESVADDYGIQYFRDRAFYQPVIFHCTEFDVIAVTNGTEKSALYQNAHEFGHALLNHREAPENFIGAEDEANYFADKIVGEMTFLEKLYGYVRRHIRNPWRSIIHNPGNWEDYTIGILERNHAFSETSNDHRFEGPVFPLVKFQPVNI